MHMSGNENTSAFSFEELQTVNVHKGTWLSLQSVISMEADLIVRPRICTLEK
jgi:hypothetical protein